MRSARAEPSAASCFAAAARARAWQRTNSAAPASATILLLRARAAEDDDNNALCVVARIVSPEVIGELVCAYLNAEFSGAGRHARRLRKAMETEDGEVKIGT